MSLEGKIALVTGAARGIGRTTALVLAEKGADVGVVDLSPAVEETRDAIAGTGRRSVAAVLDISEPAAVAAGVEKIRAGLGDVGVLVNAAAIVDNIAPLTEMSVESWDRELRVNLGGAFHMIRAVIGPMIEKRWGRIVNISSIAAIGGLHRQAGYASTKAGLLGLTQTVTLEHARDGITCNAILPGLIATELVQRMPAELRDAFVASVPARRLGTMREVAELIAFLASDGAGFVNGAAIRIDGGAALSGPQVGSRKELRARLGG